MKKIRLDDCICSTHLVDHSLIKDRILLEIEKTFGGKRDVRESYGANSRISKLDWDIAEDFERPWVKIFLPNFKISIAEMLSSMAYSAGMSLVKIWYQQYLEGNTHEWHIHGNHFTGVYYLEYSKGNGKTEICSPYSMRTVKLTPKEGDIIIFPAHWIHRALPNNKKRKTIISFNFDLEMVDPDINLIKGGKPYILF